MRTQLGVGVSEGELVDGKYRVEKLLGQGGMGAVFSARHIRLDERVAIKLLLPDMLGNVEVIERFAREARAAVRIKSEHVARVLDVGLLPQGLPFMVMEFLEGTDLRERLGTGEPLPIAQAVDFLLQACEAIAEAHSLGIIHRDLKPENLFCVQRRDGGVTIKVLDFGISKVCITESGVVEPSLTRSIGLIGTPLYASPEQIVASRDVDARTDIWSLGIVLYEMLTNRMPFNGAAAIALYAKNSKVVVPSMRNFRAEAPEALDSIVRRCLGRQRNQRYSNVAELALDLAPFGTASARQSVERICGVLGAKREVPIGEAFQPSEPGPIGPALVATSQKRPPRRLGLAVLLLAPMAVAGAAGAYFVAGRTATQKVDVQGVASEAVVPNVPASEELPAVFVSKAQIPPLEASVEPPQTPALAAPPKPLVARRRSDGAHASGSSSGAALEVAIKQTTAPSNCDPPYVLDGQGRKRFKRECFSK